MNVLPIENVRDHVVQCAHRGASETDYIKRERAHSQASVCL